jgi:SAM-dependent methyltransferase
MSVSPDAFDAFYYANCCGRPYARDEHWLKFFSGIADRIVTDIAPKTAIDAGCAMGLLVEALRERGVEAWGVDVSPFAIQRVPDSVQRFCRQASIVEPFPQRADLIVCIEVMEHMPPAEADAAIANLCAHTDDVLFSSSPNDHREPTHVNVRPAEDWAEQFARHRFFRDPEFDATFVTPWAARFRRSSDPFHRIVRAYERRLARLEQERYDMRAFTAEAQGKQATAEQMTEHVRGVLTGEIDSLRASVESMREAAQSTREANERARFAEETVRNMEQSVFWKLRKIFRR